MLRDCVLGLLADDPTLEPRDVLVMCPDIEDFAPLISATFGANRVEHVDGDDDGDRPPGLRVRLADRAVRQTNPVLGTVSALLDLTAGRVAASAVLDLADRDPVRRRFGLDDDDLGRLERWVADTGVRWGIEAEHRKPFKLDVVPEGTWRAGLDRMLLGAAVAEGGGRLWGGTLPLDDVDSGAIDLAGRFAELLDRLDDARTRLGTAQPSAQDRRRRRPPGTRCRGDERGRGSPPESSRPSRLYGNSAIRAIMGTPGLCPIGLRCAAPVVRFARRGAHKQSRTRDARLPRKGGAGRHHEDACSVNGAGAAILVARTAGSAQTR